MATRTEPDLPNRVVKLPDLVIEQEVDGTFNLQQGHDNPVWISLHPSQVRVLAELARFLPAGASVKETEGFEPSISAAADLADQLRIVRDRLELLAKAVLACPTRGHTESPRAFETLQYMATVYLGEADPDDQVAAQLMADGGARRKGEQLPLPDWRL